MPEPRVLVDGMLRLVCAGKVPRAGYAVKGNTLYRNGTLYGIVEHLVLKPYGTEVHYHPLAEQLERAVDP